MNPKVDRFFDRTEKWKAEMQKLRMIALDSNLDEELKWGQPCYSLQDKNIVLIHAFKEYCALLFFKGVLLKDDHHILIQQTKNVQSARQLRFTNLKEIGKLAPVISSYIQEAIEVEKAGVQVKLKKVTEYEIPEEFQKRLNKSAALKKAFQALTPGRQKGYLFYFSQAKLPKTREDRVEKNIKRILAGKGLED